MFVAVTLYIAHDRPSAAADRQRDQYDAARARFAGAGSIELLATRAGNRGVDRCGADVAGARHRIEIRDLTFTYPEARQDVALGRLAYAPSPARRSASSARPAAARRRCSSCCFASMIRRAARCIIGGIDVHDLTLGKLAQATSPTCRRKDFCSARRFATISPSPTAARSSAPGGRGRAAWLEIYDEIEEVPRRIRDEARRTGIDAVRRTAAANEPGAGTASRTRRS